jgi:hypothetical protein
VPSDISSAVTSVKADPATAVAEDRSGFLERRREERNAKAAARDEVEAIALYAAAGDAGAVAALPAAVAKARTLYKAADLEKKLRDIMAAAIRSVIDDDVLTPGGTGAHLPTLGRPWHPDPDHRDKGPSPVRRAGHRRHQRRAATAS